MRGKRAKAIRKKIYGDLSVKERKYFFKEHRKIVDKKRKLFKISKQIVSDRMRQVYQKAKRIFKGKTIQEIKSLPIIIKQGEFMAKKQKANDDGLSQFTVWEYPWVEFRSCYGKTNYRMWCELEQNRLKGIGIESEIKDDYDERHTGDRFKKDKRFKYATGKIKRIALFRKTKFLKQKTNNDLYKKGGKANSLDQQSAEKQFKLRKRIKNSEKLIQDCLNQEYARG